MRQFGWISGAALAVVMSVPAWSHAAAVLPPLTLQKTVGTDPSACAAAKQIVVNKGATVYYCYKVTNNEPFTLTTHSLEDSVLGSVTLPNSGNFDLAPGETTMVTASFVINANTVNVATWMAVGTSEAMTGSTTAPFAADTVMVTANSSADVVIGATAAPALGAAALAFVAAGLLLFGAVRLSRKMRDQA